MFVKYSIEIIVKIILIKKEKLEKYWRVYVNYSNYQIIINNCKYIL